jgi:TRAP-type C4-dicarboxylate transport system permease small subunit
VSQSGRAKTSRETAHSNAEGAKPSVSPPVGEGEPGAAEGGWLHACLAGIDSLGRLSGVLAAAALWGLTLLILGEIAVRLLSTYVPGLPAGIPAAWEVSSYLMGIAFMAGAAMTLRAGGHIRVSLLMSHLPPFGQRCLEVATSLLGLCLSSFLAYSLVGFTWASYARGQTSISSDIPLWIPEAAITVGAVVLSIQMLARVVQALVGLPVEDPRLKGAATAE